MKFKIALLSTALVLTSFSVAQAATDWAGKLNSVMNSPAAQEAMKAYAPAAITTTATTTTTISTHSNRFPARLVLHTPSGRSTTNTTTDPPSPP